MKPLIAAIILATSSGSVLAQAQTVSAEDYLKELGEAKVSMQLTSIIAKSCGSPETLKRITEMSNFVDKVGRRAFDDSIVSILDTSIDDAVRQQTTDPDGVGDIIMVLKRTMSRNGQDAHVWEKFSSKIDGSLMSFLSDKGNRDRKEFCTTNETAVHNQYYSLIPFKDQAYAQVEAMFPNGPVGGTPTNKANGNVVNNDAPNNQSGVDETALTKAYVYTLAATDCYEAREGFMYQILTSNDLQRAKQLARSAEDAFVSNHGKAKADAVWTRVSNLYTTPSPESGNAIPRMFDVDTSTLGPMNSNPQAVAIASAMGNPLTLNGTAMVAHGASWPSLFGNKDYEGNETICQFVKQNVLRQDREVRTGQLKRNF